MYRFFISVIGLCVAVSFLSGATYGAWIFHPAPLPVVIADISPPVVPVVHLDGIRNGALVGSVSGNVRLAARGAVVSPASDGTFLIADSKLLTNIIEIIIPEGMRFVASKRGKKYYPVQSASAAGLSPANRIYFPTEQAARSAGFVP